ncbi:MAG: hypothetical protein ABIJ45_14115 [Candidatus Zixiibacteriota bacterium]
MTKTKNSTKTAKEKSEKPRPLPINIISWFGIVFSLTFLIMGTVNIILSIMDRTYAEMDKNFIILLYGIPVLLISIGFRNMQKWGWYGLGGIFILIIVLSLFSLDNIYGIVLGILSLAALIGLFLPSVKKHYLTD